jgi:uncharacterized protein YjbJ (UPF0337 family)
MTPAKPNARGGAMGSGTRDKAEGKWDEVKGKVKEGVGDATDDESLEAEGKKDQLKGHGKQAWGDVKDAGNRVKEAVKDATD